MKIFINFANKKFASQQKLALKTARIFGGFDKVIGYTPENIDDDFWVKNEQILSQPKGAGLWLWKPYFIYKTLMEAKEGDYIFYLDSGYFFTHSVNYLVDVLEKSDQEIMSFQTYYPEEQWTKKSLFERMGCKGEEFEKTNQFMATMCLLKNSDRARRFVQEWLLLACDYANISDAENGDGGMEFVEHRHDQSIYSLLCKREGLSSFKAPYIFAELGAAYAVMKKTSLVYDCKLTFNFGSFANSNYPVMLQVNKPFNFLGLNLNLFFIPLVYFKVLNLIPFRSSAYNFLLRLGMKGLG